MRCLKANFILLFVVFSNLSYSQMFDKGIPIDSSIWNIKLGNYKSTEKVIGHSAWNNCFEANNMLPRIELLNKNKMQVLRLFFHYGGNRNSVDEFEIKKIDSTYKIPTKCILVKDSTAFISSRNIMLGYSKPEVTSKLGSNYTTITKDSASEEIIYKLEGSDSDFLKRHNELTYYIKCLFIKGVLVDYSFGFEYV